MTLRRSTTLPGAAADAQPARGTLAALRAWRAPLAWLQLSVLFAILGLLPLATGVDADFWWHLRTGEIIFESGIPQTDPFSWTAGGQAWTLHEWLSELIIYIVQSTFGYAGNVALFSAVTIGAFCVMYGVARRDGAGSRVLLLLMFIAIVMMMLFITVRPQVFSWLLFAVFVAILARRDRGEPAPLWVLPPLMLLWANLHLGVVYGLMVVAFWGVSVGIDRVRGRDVDLRAPVLAGVACGLATLATPSGIDIVAYPFRYLEDSGSTEIIVEWQRPNFFNPLMAPFLLAILLLAGALISKERPRPFLLLVSVAVIALSLQAVRSMPFVALMLVAVAGPMMGRRWRWASSASDAGVTISAPKAAFIAVTAAVAIGSVALYGGATASLGAPTERAYPQEGAAYLEESLGERRLYNDYSWGGYLIYKLYPDAPVFIDGRSDLYRSGLIDDYVAIARLEPGWAALLDEYAIDVALMRKKSRLAEALRADARWREALTGEYEAVFERVDSSP